MTVQRRLVPSVFVVADLQYAGGERPLLAVLEALATVASDPRVAIQLRARALGSGDLTRLAAAARRRVPQSAHLVLNGASSVAARLGYTGVHWPEAAIPAQAPDAPPWQSAAVHSADALVRAERAGVDAAVFGSVFAPGSKHGEAAGLEALRAVCAQRRMPVLALGGVSAARVPACLEAGAAGIAVVSGVLGAADPAGAVREYLDAIEAARASVPGEREVPA